MGASQSQMIGANGPAQPSSLELYSVVRAPAEWLGKLLPKSDQRFVIGAQGLTENSDGISAGQALRFAKGFAFSLLVMLAVRKVSQIFVDYVVYRQVGSLDHISPSVRKKYNLCGQVNSYEAAVADCIVDVEELDRITMEDIGGLDEIKRKIEYEVIWPNKNPSLFKNSKLVNPVKGVLLHGPPGCGKTMLVKMIAKESGFNMLAVDPATLMSKWYGDSQKLVLAVFTLAEKIQPCIIFIDEIDALMRNRTSLDHESSSLIKTQFMSYLDGLCTNSSNRIIIIGATNRPISVDEAIKRRMPLQLMIPLPGLVDRIDIFKKILRNENVEDIEYALLASHTKGCSGSDINEICKDAARRHFALYMQTRQLDLANESEETKILDKFKDPESIQPLVNEDILKAILEFMSSRIETCTSHLPEQTVHDIQKLHLRTKGPELD